MKPSPALQSAAGTLFASHEKNTDFRMLLLRHCKNGVCISGILGTISVLAYVSSNLYFFDREITWWYDFEAGKNLVLWDKLLIITLSLVLIILSRLNLSLNSYRYIFMGFALICGFAILLDDILNRDVNFSSGYLTILLLISASCIPFKPWQMFLLGTAIVLMLFPGLLYLPGLFGIHDLDIVVNQVIHLSMIAIILAGVSAFLYQSRYTTYMVRRKADGFLENLYDEDSEPDPNNILNHEKRLLTKNFTDNGELLVSDINVPSVDQVFLDKVKGVIEKHLGDSNFGVEWLAHEVAISPRQLQRRLKASTGLSAGGLIRVMRLQRSAQLLKQNAGNVSEIAYKIGFNDPIYFSRIFRKMYGVNPSEYAKTKRNTA